MKWTIRTALAAALAIVGSGYTAQASFFSYPRALTLQLDKIRFETPTLAPIAYTRFCLQYPDDCHAHSVIFRPPHPVVLTAAHAEDLIEVNRDVNRAIAPREDAGTLLDERWIVGPKAGACHDYAVTKRHELLTRGWPSRSLLLAEVVVPWGEHHLILVVRTKRWRSGSRQSQPRHQDVVAYAIQMGSGSIAQRSEYLVNRRAFSGARQTRSQFGG